MMMPSAAMSIAATAIMARILSPSDYGLFGMVTGLTAVLVVIADSGLSWATVQHRDLSKAQMSSMFWGNVLLGLLLWCVAVAADPAVVAFFRVSKLAGITTVYGMTLFLNCLSAQPMALMRREMRFRELSVVDAAAGAMGSITGVALAMGGWGYWSLVAPVVLASFMRVALLLHVSGFRPSVPAVPRHSLSLMCFGGSVTSYCVLEYVGRHIDNVLVGKYFGAEQLGFYGRAYFLVMLPSVFAASTFTKVLEPALAVLRADRARFGEAYRRTLQIIAFVGFPMTFGLAVVAPEAVRLVYGSHWGPVVPLLRYLSVAGTCQLVYGTVGPLFVASGRGRDLFVWGLVAYSILTAAIFVGVQWGVNGVALACASIMAVVFVGPGLYFAHRAAQLDVSRSFEALVLPLLASGFMALSAFAIGSSLAWLGKNWMWVLLGKVTSGAVVYLLSCLFISRQRIPSVLTEVHYAFMSSLVNHKASSPSMSHVHAE
jgi:O-antigen/teichoic acid export membrane protein